MSYNNYYTAVAFSTSVSKTFEIFYKSKSILLVRTDSGIIKAYLNRCPHRGASLTNSSLKQDILECPYHGWQYDIQSGENKLVPVKNEKTNCKLHKVFAQEKYGIIWISDNADAKLPKLNSKKETFTYKGTINAKLINILENFLEGSHTHFVHNGLIRTNNKIRQKISGNFVPTNNGFEVHYEPEKPKGWATRLLPGKFRNLKPVATFIFPYTAILSYYNERNEEVAVFETILTNKGNTVDYFAKVYLNIGGLTPIIKPFTKKFFQKIIQQDKTILELQEKNLQQFTDLKFHSDETDLVGTQLEAWHFNPDKKLTVPHTFNIYW